MKKYKEVKELNGIKLGTCKVFNDKHGKLSEVLNIFPNGNNIVRKDENTPYYVKNSIGVLNYYAKEELYQADIFVYCGESIEKFDTNKCIHPVNEVKEAIDYIENFKQNEEVLEIFSNNIYFVMAMKYIGERQNIKVGFFLNRTYCGNDIESIFSDFNNRSLDLIDKFGTTEE